MQTGQQNRAVSDTFSLSKGGDVIFCSSDNVLFYIHKKNLEFSTGGFPMADFTSSQVTNADEGHTSSPKRTAEIVPLTETGSILEILFQFVYPQRHPSLDDMNWVTFSGLAEAAEKYEVYNAMNVCQIRMRDYIPQHAAEIFGFAAKHDYPNVIALVAPLLVGKPLDEVAEILPYYIYVPWSIYQQKYTQTALFVLGRAFSFSACSAYSSHTDRLHRTVSLLQQVLQEDPGRVTKFSELLNEIGNVPAVTDGVQNVFNILTNSNPNVTKLGRLADIDCAYCHMSINVDVWIEEVEREVVQIPDFLSFLKRYRHVGDGAI
ncbi:hypothetical protein K435DRAFT_751668 [Dendrothele bispora CBS 962.96]|uniref:BTB domain-containing protein n=1 Tax=Dendrothele bispora (strain CBS 962.96) TaxID=1314807 RepID=A0A4S8MB82_DENBC|nr:hypothetical protein K435DRAFT_751668 [Dendrothele bispora CBS 962.96]